MENFPKYFWTENGHQFVAIGFGTMIMAQIFFAKNLIQHILMELLPNDKINPLKVMESELENV